MAVYGRGIVAKVEGSYWWMIIDSNPLGNVTFNINKHPTIMPDVEVYYIDDTNNGVADVILLTVDVDEIHAEHPGESLESILEHMRNRAL